MYEYYKRLALFTIVAMILILLVFLWWTLNSFHTTKTFIALYEQQNEEVKVLNVLLEESQEKILKMNELIELQNTEIEQLKQQINDLTNELNKITTSSQVKTITKNNTKNNTVSRGTSKNDLIAYIEKVAKENNYDSRMLKAIIQVESNWDPTKVSPTGDYGLCQINKINHAYVYSQLKHKYGKQDLFNPYYSIDAMIVILNRERMYFRNTYNKEPDIQHLLTAYNKGFGGLKKLMWKNGHSDYSQKVINAMKDF